MTLALQRDSLWTPVLALDRLNSWLRAEDCDFWQVQAGLKRVIYSTKVHAILDISRRWHIGLRRVMVRKPCRTCDGTGLWVPWSSQPHWDESWEDYRANYGERCRGCGGTGVALLKFIESQIGPTRWHTPSREWCSWSLDIYVPFLSYHFEADHDHAEQYYETARGWEPNLPGRPLCRAEVERDLHLVMRSWPHALCSAIDFHFDAGLERRWNCPDTAAAARWLSEYVRHAHPPARLD